MNEKNAKRLEELGAIARDPAKLSKLLLDGFEVCRGLGEHFETMNGSPQLKRLSNLAADIFGIMHARMTTREALAEVMASVPVAAVALKSLIPEGHVICGRCHGVAVTGDAGECYECEGKGYLPIGAISKASARTFQAVERALQNPELAADAGIVAMPALADRPSVPATLATEPEPFEERRTEDRTEGRLGDIAYQTPDEATKFPEGQTIPMAEPIPPPPDDCVPPPTKAPAAKKPKPAPTSGPPMF